MKLSVSPPVTSDREGSTIAILDEVSPLEPGAFQGAVAGAFLSATMGAAMCCAPIAVAQDEARTVEKELHIVRTDTRPVIDGLLDEAVWATAPMVDDFVVSEPNEGDEPSEYTQVRVLYDRDSLFVAVRAFLSNPEILVARVLRQGESTFGDDGFSIILDPFNNQRSGYFLSVNANGVRDDALYENTTSMAFNWDGIYHAATSRNEDGWIAEIEIPFKTLSFDPENDTWGINFQRQILRRGERVIWVARNRAMNPSVTGSLIGIRDVNQGLGLDVVPSASVNLQKEHLISVTESNFDPSIDLFYKVTPSLNASLTVNTDFSATEVDDRQVNLTRFNLFFPEKRDFFLRDTDIFQFGRITGNQFGEVRFTAASRASRESAKPFFSRRIGLSAGGLPVDLNYGGKLSGRIGRWDVGALAIRQEEFQGIDATDVIVARGAVNVLAESSIGFIATSGDPRSNRDNSVVGVDFRFLNTRLPGGNILRGDAWYLDTETEGVHGDSAAFGIGLQLPNAAGWQGGFDLREIQEHYNPALGFVDRRGVRDVNAAVGYRHWLREGFLRAIFAGVDTHRVDLLEGGLQSKIVKFRVFEAESRQNDEFGAFYSSNSEVLSRPFEISPGVVIPAGEYSFDDYGFDIMSGRQRAFTLNGGIQAGDFYGGDRFNIRGQLSWNASRHFRASVGYDYNEVDVPQGEFETRLVRLRMDLIFSSRWAWVNLVQYDNVSRTTGLNSRIEWVPAPGREGFIVLNHNMGDSGEGDRFNPITSDLAVKFSYTFRF